MSVCCRAIGTAILRFETVVIKMDTRDKHKAKSCNCTKLTCFCFFLILATPFDHTTLFYLIPF